MLPSFARPRARARRADGSAHEPRRGGGRSLQAGLLWEQLEPALRRPAPGEARLGVRCQSGGHALCCEACRQASKNKRGGRCLLSTVFRIEAVMMC